ncbi:MAG: FliG C-terminal domain-containing protein [Pirellulales bacterium]
MPFVSESANPLRKAAILVATLDRATADRLLDQMTEEQSRAVRDEVLKLDDIPLETQQAVLREFFGESAVPAADQSSATTTNEVRSNGGVELDLRGGSEPEIYDETWGNDPESKPVNTSTSNPLAFLEELEPDALRPHLEPEHPQTIAVVLAHMSPRYAAALLSGFSPVVQADLARRIIDLDDADPEVLQDLARSFSSIVDSHLRKQRRRKSGITRLAEILAVASEPAERRILENLDAVRSDLSPRIETMRRRSEPVVPDVIPFVPLLREHDDFNELAQLTDDELLRVLQNVDAVDVVRALADDSGELTDRVSRRLPRQQARMLERALRDVGPLRREEVDAAKQSLFDAAVRLGLIVSTVRFQAA